jgi:hypothetical protein
LWTLAIVCSCLSSGSFFVSEWFSVFIVSNCGSACANIPSLDRANGYTKIFLQRVLRVIYSFLRPITSWPRRKLVSTLTACSMIEIISPTTLERSAYF